MTPCALHNGLSTTICGCGSSPEATQKPDTHRDFTELSVGTRVRFAHALREVELCGQCRLPAVRIEDVHRRVRRRAWIHDATISGAGFFVGAECVEYVYPKKRK